MSSDALTRDNPLLSRLTLGTADALTKSSHARVGALVGGEINFTAPLPENVADYLESGLAYNSRRAYAADLDHFEAWGGGIPATDLTVARYLADHAKKLSVATLGRRLATISKAHTAKGLASPTASELVRTTMRGIRRTRGTAQAAAKPVLRDNLFAVLAQMGNDMKSVRDRAVLLLGFAGGFRRSELVNLDVTDLESVRHGMIVRLRRSKTDQESIGRKIGIPFGRTRWCPVHAIDDWMNRAQIESGPLFRAVNRHGHVSKNRLSGEAVALILQERMKDAGFDSAGYSGHSLRSGFATSAAMAGACMRKIRAQTGHASDAMLSRYIRDSEMFVENAAALLL